MIYDQNIPNASRRSGGREARRSLRAAPLQGTGPRRA